MTEPSNFNKKRLKTIWNQVPPNYYENGVENNFFQKFWHLNKLKAILGLINCPPSRVLDVGCASGWFLSKISQSFPEAKCLGIDPYAKAVKYGQKKYQNLLLIKADGHRLPFKSQSFDLIICTEVLEHVLNPGKVVKEIGRVLDYHGTAIFEMDSGSWFFKLAWFCWTHSGNNIWHHAHLHAFNDKKLRKLIEGNGFQVTQAKKFNYSMAVAYRAKRR